MNEEYTVYTFEGDCFTTKRMPPVPNYQVKFLVDHNGRFRIPDQWGWKVVSEEFARARQKPMTPAMRKQRDEYINSQFNRQMQQRNALCP